MKSIIKIALAATVVIFAQNVNAQDTSSSTKQSDKTIVEQRQYLEDKLQSLISKEKESLKKRVTLINEQVAEGLLTKEQADEQKQSYAREIALNIENQTAIIENQIALLERKKDDADTSVLFDLGDEDGEGKRVFGISINASDSEREIRYDRRTYSELVLAFGLNNAVVDNGEFGEDFRIGKSRFFELGYAWKTRVFPSSGALQFKYGFSFQINKLFIDANETLVDEDGVMSFEEFPFNLKKSQLRFSNLVVPVHLEFGGWKKEQGENYVRYRTGGKFRMGIGGYVGLRLGTQQKLKYKENGDNIKTKEKQDFGGDAFVYGISSYIRLGRDLSLYGKYDLSTAFKTQEFGEVRNVSLGLRWDW